MKFFIIKDSDKVVGIVFHDYINNNLFCRSKYESFIRSFNNSYSYYSNRLINKDGNVYITNNIKFTYKDSKLIVEKMCNNKWSISVVDDVSFSNSVIDDVCSKYLPDFSS